MPLQHPQVLSVETGLIALSSGQSELPANVLDYRIYSAVPRWWRRIEEKLRLDIYLAYRAKKIAHDFDVVWAASEKVAFPLSLMGITRPLVVVVHTIESPARRIPARILGLPKRWSAVGYVAHSSRDTLLRDFGVGADRVFHAFSVRVKALAINEAAPEGPILSLGTAKRDYETLIAALEQLPDHRTEIYTHSRYGDAYRGKRQHVLPAWVTLNARVPDAELVGLYGRARFVVVPLHTSHDAGAGASAALEASASGKAVIATRTAGMPTFVLDGETGILVPPYDAAAMREAIRRLWTQPDVAKKMGLAGRRHAQANFDADLVNQDITAVLDRVYAESKNAALRRMPNQPM